MKKLSWDKKIQKRVARFLNKLVYRITHCLDIWDPEAPHLVKFREDVKNGKEPF